MAGAEGIGNKSVKLTEDFERVHQTAVVINELDLVLITLVT